MLLAACSAGCAASLGLEQCETTQDCYDRGLSDAVCTPTKYCASIYSADCQAMLGGPLEPDSILIALMTKLEGQSRSLGESARQAASLALEELTSYGKGVVVDPSKAPDKLRLLVCNDGSNDVEAVRIARRLVEELQIPIIMGPVFSNQALAVATQVTIPNGALMLNPFSVTPLLTPLNDHNLVWRTSVSNEPEGWGMAQLVALIEQDLRDKDMIDKNTLIRIATVARPDIYGLGLVDNFNKAWYDLRGTSQPVLNNLKPFLLTSTPQGYTFDVSQLIDFKPHIVITAGTGEMIPTVIAATESSRKDFQPHYIGSEGVRLSDLLQYVQKENTQRVEERLHVFAPAVNQTLYSELKKRWQQRYMSDVPDIYGVANTYDAMYLLAYGLATLGDSAVSGANAASGFKRLVPPPGKRIPVGPTFLTDAYLELQKSGRFDLDGASGSLDFNLDTGDPPGVFDVLCISGTPYNFTPSGMQLSSDKNGPTFPSTYIPCKN